MIVLEPDKIYKLTQILTSNRRELFLLLYRQILMSIKDCERKLDQEGSEEEFWDSAAKLQGYLDELTRSVDAQFKDTGVDLFKLHQYYYNRLERHLDIGDVKSPAMRFDFNEMRKTFSILYKLFAEEK